MEQLELIKLLKELMQLDFDAIQTYDHAIEKSDLESVRSALETFRSDHERHISNLTRLLADYGVQADTPTRALKGAALEALTMLRSITGTKGALKAMRTNEKVTNKAYEEALEADVPEHVRQLLVEHRADEARHLSYIERALDQFDQIDQIETTPPTAR